MPDAERKTLAQGSSVKEDLQTLFNLGDDAYAQLLSVCRAVKVGADQLARLVTDTRNLKANDSEVIGGITLLRDQTDNMDQTLSDLQQILEAQGQHAVDLSRRELQVLGSVVETLLGVVESLESVKAAVVGHHSYVKEHPCPWMADIPGMTTEARSKVFVDLIQLMPHLQLVILEAADKGGWLAELGKPPKQKWWLRKLMDQLRAAIIAAFFSTLATAKVGVFAWSYFFSAKTTVVDRAMTQAAEQEKARVQAEQARKDKQIADLLDEVERLKAKRRPTPPK